jgi:hypothetical protein
LILNGHVRRAVVSVVLQVFITLLWLLVLGRRGASYDVDATSMLLERHESASTPYASVLQRRA